MPTAADRTDRRRYAARTSWGLCRAAARRSSSTVTAWAGRRLRPQGRRQGGPGLDGRRPCLRRLAAVAFDNGSTVPVIDAGTPEALGPGAGRRRASQTEAVVEPERARNLVYVQGANLMVVASPTSRATRRAPSTLRQAGFSDHDPALAPTPKRDRGGVHPTWASQSEPVLRDALNGAATAAAPGRAGMGSRQPGRVGSQWQDDSRVRERATRGHSSACWRTRARCRTRGSAANWGSPTPQTNDSVSKVGVIAGEFSPNGKQMALISNAGGNGFELYVVPDGRLQPDAGSEPGRRGMPSRAGAPTARRWR